MNRYEVLILGIRYSILFVLLFILSLLSIPTIVHAQDKPYPGELVNIGTHRLHINCIGQGSPTVIIDSGIGGFSLEWITIQNNLADNLKVCSYDRAGYGWSDPGPIPRTTDRITYELYSLLVESKIPGPYLLVGHSFGGYNIRYFASKYPNLTAGMILVDSSHPEQFNTEEFKRIEKKQENNTPKNSYKVRIIYPIISDSYPAENKRIAFRLMSTMKFRSTLLNEMENMEISAKQVSRETNHPPYIFPVTILTRGKRVWAYDDLGDRREQQWLRLQNDLEHISMQSRHYLAEKSGHIIHLDQPDFVSNNIISTVMKIRSQFHARNLNKKFDIHLPTSMTAPLFEGFDALQLYEIDSFNKIPAAYKPLSQVLFNTKYTANKLNPNYRAH